MLTRSQLQFKDRIGRLNRAGFAICLISLVAQVATPVIWGTSLGIGGHIVPVVIVVVLMWLFSLSALSFKDELRPLEASMVVFSAMSASLLFWIPVGFAVVYMRLNYVGLFLVHFFGIVPVWLILLVSWSFWMKALVRKGLVLNRDSWRFFAIFALLSAVTGILGVIGAFFAGGYALTN